MDGARRFQQTADKLQQKVQKVGSQSLQKVGSQVGSLVQHYQKGKHHMKTRGLGFEDRVVDPEYEDIRRSVVYARRITKDLNFHFDSLVAHLTSVSESLTAIGECFQAFADVYSLGEQENSTVLSVKGIAEATEQMRDTILPNCCGLTQTTHSYFDSTEERHKAIRKIQREIEVLRAEVDRLEPLDSAMGGKRTLLKTREATYDHLLAGAKQECTFVMEQSSSSLFGVFHILLSSLSQCYGDNSASLSKVVQQVNALKNSQPIARHLTVERRDRLQRERKDLEESRTPVDTPLMSPLDPSRDPSPNMGEVIMPQGNSPGAGSGGGSSFASPTTPAMTTSPSAMPKLPSPATQPQPDFMSFAPAPLPTATASPAKSPKVVDDLFEFLDGSPK